ncbi:stage III sporulation protein AA [Peribacillus deserti]|uniref:Stage III sporulation protein AA n=1 Tax=Peribacillus deserti TaxID=673318 RepID=A0ABS2QJY6_9BACI|nr:stage III sporulation protein AA [Peribacillus deserti]MBM7693265.1 stage III sporulation protein AA [Peribacillus deserti]
MDSVLSILPRNIGEQLKVLPPALQDSMEEIRIRIARPLEVIAGGVPYFLPYLVSNEDSFQLLNALSQFSLYTIEEELRRGYVTIEGGHRVGLAGKVVLENSSVKAIRDISSYNIRIARQKIGAAESLVPYLFDGNWKHTLLIGAPQTGKTTLLRDIARIVSTGIDSKGIVSRKVGIVDERSEIAGCVRGIPQLELGPRVDILDSCPKAEGMMMLIRSMSPDVLVVDEIGRREDTEAVLEAANAGIKLIITTHGNSLEEINKRPIIQKILDQHIFERFIEITRGANPGTISTIRDAAGKKIRLEAGAAHA